MIDTIRLQNFRSYSDASFEFENGVNIIVGPNASGKTNLLEAILVAARGKSYRVSDAELLRHDADWARIDTIVSNTSRVVKITRSGDHIDKSYEINDTNLKRLTHTRTLPIVLFEPNHLLLLTQSPDLRRNYIDDVLEQLHPEFAQVRRDYKRTLSQRNRLLKQQAPISDFFVWNVRLSELGGQIARQRHHFAEDNTIALHELYATLVEGTHSVALQYKTLLPVDDYSNVMLHTLEQTITRDQERGFTTTGPHRDDLIMSIDGHQLAHTASRGETRTMLLALKLLEVKALERVRGDKPMLLLDDVFSELDGARRRKLTDYLTSYQTFITTTDADIVVQHFLGNCHVIAMG